MAKDTDGVGIHSNSNVLHVRNIVCRTRYGQDIDIVFGTGSRFASTDLKNRTSILPIVNLLQRERVLLQLEKLISSTSVYT